MDATDFESWAFIYEYHKSELNSASPEVEQECNQRVFLEGVVLKRIHSWDFKNGRQPVCHTYQVFITSMLSAGGRNMDASIKQTQSW